MAASHNRLCAEAVVGEKYAGNVAMHLLGRQTLPVNPQYSPGINIATSNQRTGRTHGNDRSSLRLGNVAYFFGAF
jgi:hypothetical protein